MSEQDWIESFVTYQKSQRRDEQIELRKSELALAGAPRLFRSITDEVQRDVGRYRDAGGHHPPSFERNSDSEFTVRQPVYPATMLTVKLNETTIEYRYWHCSNDTYRGSWKSAHLRIVANLEGSVQATQNDVTFSSPAEISRALLTPVFDYGDR